MGSIRILDDSTINRIAAGEVIQRPASVVKELIENAIDAGARRIQVSVEDGGRRLIRVADDGTGMDEDDILLAIERHATSKVREGEDIFGADSLGFRGEALPSIAAVSKTVIESCSDPGNGGRRLICHGGRILDLSRVPRARGTTVEVKSLFYNTPARRKFLAGRTVELGHVREAVTSALLTHPDIAFSYHSDGKRLIASPGDGDVLKAMARVFGNRDGASMVLLSRRKHPSLPFSIHGAVSTGLASRSAASGIILSVNGRVFRSHAINRLLQRVYAPYIEARRWPLAVLFIEADPRTVDVNVHPAKLEVRFSFFDKLSSFIASSVADTVRQALPTAGTSLCLSSDSVQSSLPDSTKGSPVLAQPRAGDSADRPYATGLFGSHEGNRSFTGETVNGNICPKEMPWPGTRDSGTEERWEQKARPAIAPGPGQGSGMERVPSPAAEPIPEQVFRRRIRGDAAAADITVLGQVFDTYLLVLIGERLYFCDQHAAHERILYERCLDRQEGTELIRQGLLAPRLFELADDEAELLSANGDLLDQAGLDWEMTPGGILIRAYPVLFASQDIFRTIADLLDGIRELAGERTLSDRKEALAAMVACKGAIKANQPLTTDEMHSLVSDLLDCRHPARCPHGRPTMVEVEKRDLEKVFLRRT